MTAGIATSASCAKIIETAEAEAEEDSTKIETIRIKTGKVNNQVAKKSNNTSFRKLSVVYNSTKVS